MEKFPIQITKNSKHVFKCSRLMSSEYGEKVFLLLFQQECF